MNPETSLQNKLRLKLHKLGVLNFRNNTGALKDKNDRLVRYGLCKGSSDIIGIRPVRITPEMVNEIIGQFVAVEVKVPGKRATDDQQQFLQAVRGHGGLAGVAHSEEEVADLLARPSYS